MGAAITVPVLLHGSAVEPCASGHASAPCPWGRETLVREGGGSQRLHRGRFQARKGEEEDLQCSLPDFCRERGWLPLRLRADFVTHRHAPVQTDFYLFGDKTAKELLTDANCPSAWCCTMDYNCLGTFFMS